VVAKETVRGGAGAGVTSSTAKVIGITRG